MRKFITLSLFLCLTPLAAWAAPTAGDNDAAVLAQMQRLAADVTTLQSDFVQEKHLSMFQEVLRSKGRFFFARPDRLRWELTDPVAAGFVLVGGKGRRWNAHSGPQEPFELTREPVMQLVAEQLFAWAAVDLERLRRSYRITVVQRAPVVLNLEPLAAAGGFLDYLRVAFAEDGRHVAMVEVHEQGGDFTRIRFVKAKVNSPLPDELF
jgi:outer membrane lipoprotein-sorting protein